MSRRRGLLLAVLACAVGFYFGRGEARVVSAQGQIARCLAQVPPSWGEFRGGSDYGLAFEDGSGTIRLVRQIPCGGGRAAPAVPEKTSRN